LKLPRWLIVETYALCRQAERSVDKVLDGRWPEFTAYYRGKRLTAVKRVVEHLRSSASGGTCDPSPGRDELMRNSGRPGLVRFLFGKWLAAGKKEWSIPCREVGFTATVLQGLARLIEQEESPDPDTLVELRMDLWAAQWLIDGHCCGLPELARAVRMEHFMQSDHLATITLADLIRHPESDNEHLEHTP
jgi:hypothetical protein